MKALHRFAKIVAGCTVVLVLAGSLVTSTASGLSVPDWPTSYGWNMFTFPPSHWVGGILYEHGHRLIASTVGFLTIILAVWLWRTDPRRWVKWLGVSALGAVIAQGVLGGLTVLFFLPAAISTAHAGLAEIFFCVTVSIALVTSPAWIRGYSDSSVDDAVLRRVAATTTVLIYAQILIGATMRHTGAGLAIPDFPLMFGHVIPDHWDPKIAIHFAHRVGALVVSLAILATSAHVFYHHGDRRELTRPAALILGLVAVQVTLGALTVLSGRDVAVNSAHVVVGALVLATSLVITLRSWRDQGVGSLLQNVPTGGHILQKAPDPHMTTLAVGRSSTRAADFLALTKPRLNVLVVATSAAGYYLGAPSGAGAIDLAAMAFAVAGTALVAGGAAVLNQVYERDTDALMRRTRLRPLPDGRVASTEAAIFGFVLSAGGLALLATRANALAALLAFATLVTYLAIYTPMKLRTPLATLVGAVPGALPPLIGWTASHGTIWNGGLVLFAIVFFWQIPHFMAIAWLYREDYGKAGFPMLPVIDPAGRRAGIQAIWSALLLVAATIAPALNGGYGISGSPYLLIAIALGAALLWLVLRFASARNDATARRLFLGSIIYLPLLWIAMIATKR